jgi:hypothetical protein
MGIVGWTKFSLGFELQADEQRNTLFATARAMKRRSKFDDL